MAEKTIPKDQGGRTSSSVGSWGVDVDRLPRTVELRAASAGPGITVAAATDGTVAGFSEAWSTAADDAPARIEFVLLDQRLLPQRVEYLCTADWRVVVDAIKTLAVRGAPALGVSGAASLALWLYGWCEDEEASHADGGFDADAFAQEMAYVAQSVANARPTAVNLAWGTRLLEERLLACARELQAAGVDGACARNGLRHAAYGLVKRMEAADEAANRTLGRLGAELLPDGARILTHCNAGSLATVFYGTALGVVYAAAEQGKVARVFADETRPVGQGARLTVWELARAGVPVTLECDGMAAFLMARGLVDAVVVGADRIAANGDTANKIGTYGLAVLARHHGIPFYVAAPASTFDLSIASGKQIPIEERDASEVLPQPIEGVEVWNPAFDVTPSELVSAWITEKGVLRGPEEFCKLTQPSEGACGAGLDGAGLQGEPVEAARACECVLTEREGQA